MRALDFDYDAVGNRTLRSSDTGSGVETALYLYPSTDNRLDTVDEPSGHDRGLTYDAAGNVIVDIRADGTYSYTYNQRGRMSSVSLNGVLQAEYVYNALGQQGEGRLGNLPGEGFSPERAAAPGRLVQDQVEIHCIHDYMGNRIDEYGLDLSLVAPPSPR